MLLKNGNKETHVLNARKVTFVRRRRKRPPLRLERSHMTKRIPRGKIQIFKFTFANCARWDLSLLF